MLWDSQPIDSVKLGQWGNINSFLTEKQRSYPLQGTEPPPPRGGNPVGWGGGVTVPPSWNYNQLVIIVSEKTPIMYHGCICCLHY